MASGIAVLRGRVFQTRARSGAACDRPARPRETAEVAQPSAPCATTPMILDILNSDRTPMNQGWFWAMMKTFGG